MKKRLCTGLTSTWIHSLALPSVLGHEPCKVPFMKYSINFEQGERICVKFLEWKIRMTSIDG